MRNAIILDHPKRLELRDFGIHTPRIMAHCQFRRNKVFYKRFCPVNDAAYALRNLITDGLDITEIQLERAKQFVDIEIVNQ